MTCQDLEECSERRSCGGKSCGPVQPRAAPGLLAADVARCAGYKADGEWREGCEDCMRRTVPPVDPERVWMIAPPLVIVFECPYRIEP